MFRDMGEVGGGEVIVGRGERKLFCKDCFIYKIRIVFKQTNFLEPMRIDWR